MEVVNGQNDQRLFKQSAIFTKKISPENRPFKAHIDLAEVSDEMNFEKWCVALNQLKEAGVLYLEFVAISQKNKDLFWDLLEECHRMGFYTAVFIYQLKIDEAVVNRLDDLEVSHVSLPLHSLDKGIHDEISGETGSHDNIMKAIELLADYRINFSLNCLLTSSNIEMVYGLEDWCKSNNYLLKVDPYIKYRKYYTNTKSVQSPTTNQLKSYYQERSKRDFWHFFERSESIHSYVCDAGKTRCAINGKGELFSCLEVPTPLGSLIKEDFFSLWKNRESEYWRNLRKADLSNFSCSNGFTCEHCPGEAKRNTGDELLVSDYVRNVQEIKNNILNRMSR